MPDIASCFRFWTVLPRARWTGTAEHHGSPCEIHGSRRWTECAGLARSSSRSALPRDVGQPMRAGFTSLGDGQAVEPISAVQTDDVDRRGFDRDNVAESSIGRGGDRQGNPPVSSTDATSCRVRVENPLTRPGA